ncbi:NPCBM/NEW2 domain-containing protein [Deinococcus sp.]|uniref:NPCBM/NEW2 domain-containing protein n=1 Tax=Deinococcus sp. TaxID=47478 RepID=UPI003C7ADA93
MFRRVLWMLAPALLLAACGQSSPNGTSSSANLSEDVPWSYTAPEGGLTDASFGALSLDPGNNPLRAEPLLSATNGYGPFEINRSNGEAAKGDGKPITLNGVVYTTGFGVHSNGTLVYSLQNTQGAVCSIFQARIGVDDEVGNNGSVVFQVLTGATPATATVAYDSGVMTGASVTKSVNVNISGSKVLLLRVTDAGDGNFFDHADWAKPTIACADAARPAAGSRDTGFDSSGFGTFLDHPEIPSFTALQPDGKIVGFGKEVNPSLFFLKRLDQDGHLDSSFVADRPTPEAVTPLGLTTYPDGRILVLGLGGTPKPVPGFGQVFYFLQRFLPDGARDPSFGNGTPLFLPSLQLLNESAGFTALSLQPDGKILLGGTDTGRFFVRRLLKNGQDDTSFGSAGRVVTSFTAQALDHAYLTTLTVQPDGKILAGGGAHDGTGSGPYINAGWQLVVRYSANGTLDTSFGTNGSAKVDIGRYGASAQVLRVLPDFTLLVAGRTVTSVGDLCTLRRLNASGTLDSTYGTSVENSQYTPSPRACHWRCRPMGAPCWAAARSTCSQACRPFSVSTPTARRTGPSGSALRPTRPSVLLFPTAAAC